MYSLLWRAKYDFYERQCAIHFEDLSGLQSDNNDMIRTNQSRKIISIEPQYLLVRDIIQKTFWYIFWGS